jgi:Flp pilus assembly protein TadD/TM2 domain-containing membrane protein YozV
MVDVPETRNCSKCNAPLTANHKFCNSCGMTVPRDEGLKDCPFCAEAIKKEALKCKHCGSMLSGNEAAPNTQLAEHLTPPPNTLSSSRPIEDQTHGHQLLSALQSDNFVGAIGALSSKDQAIYNAEVERRRKNTGIAYLFFFILHWCGAEKFYIGEKGWGIAYLLSPMLAIVCLLLGFWVGSIIIAIVYFGALGFDFFCIAGQVNKANNRVRKEILEDLSQMGPERRGGLLDAPQTWILSSATISILTLGVLGLSVYQKLHMDVDNTKTTEAAKAPSEIDNSSAEKTNTTESNSDAASTAEKSSDSTAPTDVQSSKDPKELLSSILGAQKKGDEQTVSDALTRLQDLPKPAIGDHDAAENMNKDGLQFLKSKNYGAASERFRAASAQDPSDPKYLSNLGFAETYLGQLEQAQTDLTNSLVIAPARQVAWGDLGQIFAKKGEQNNAVSSLLIGYRISNGETLPYLKSLNSDDDPAVRDAGRLALEKLGQNGDPVRTPESAVDTNQASTTPSSMAEVKSKNADHWVISVTPTVGGAYGLKGTTEIFGSMDAAQGFYTGNASAMEQMAQTNPNGTSLSGFANAADRVRVIEIADGCVTG